MAVKIETILLEATALLRQGNPQGAEPLYRAVLLEQPLNVEASHGLGTLLAQRGDHAESLRLFQTALKSQPGSSQHWLSYASALLNTGHARDAQMVLARGKQRGIDGPAVDVLLREAEVALTPTQADILIGQGTAHLMEGRIKEAIDNFRQAVAIEPAHAEAHFRLGSVLSETGHIAEGFTHYMKRAALVHGGRPLHQRKPQPPHRTKHDLEQSAYIAERGGEVNYHLEDGDRLQGAAVNPSEATPDLVRRWQEGKPRVVIIDNFLTSEALQKLRRYCAGSTIWRRNYDAGYIGATPEDGLACPLMAQVAEEVRAIYPQMLGAHPFRYLGAFKYDSTLSTGTNVHADNSAVNVNFYITEDEANLDPCSGGLDIWNVSAPPGDDAMRRINGDEALARKFLVESDARMTRVPHRANRAIFFQSDLIHKTSDCRFAEGYTNKRINVSLLFGYRLD